MQLDVRAKVRVNLLKRKDLFLRGLALCSLKEGRPVRPEIEGPKEVGYFFKRLSGTNAKNFEYLRRTYNLSNAHLVEAALAAVDHSSRS